MVSEYWADGKVGGVPGLLELRISHVDDNIRVQVAGYEAQEWSRKRNGVLRPMTAKDIAWPPDTWSIKISVRVVNACPLGTFSSVVLQPWSL